MTVLHWLGFIVFVILSYAARISTIGLAQKRRRPKRSRLSPQQDWDRFINSEFKHKP